MSKIMSIVLLCLFIGAELTGCSKQKIHAEDLSENQQRMHSELPVKSAHIKKKVMQTSTESNQPYSLIEKDKLKIVTQPESLTVLINRQNKLPNNYKPADLVDTNIPFIFSQKTEKQEMRKIAAAAIEKLFAGAKKQGINLLGVSAYRSYSVQQAVFNHYVEEDGFQKAKTYSAAPGTSEHETGLAIDVTGENGKCPAENCFANSREAEWLQANAAKYGFIIRYPKGKAAITGYEYEPWHLRYVGKSIAEYIMSRGITLEEYYHAVPGNNN